jgi:hypothetical protein
VEHLRARFSRLADDRRKSFTEFDRLVATAEEWCCEVFAKAGLKPEEIVPDDLYPEEIWYAAQIRSRIEEIRHHRQGEPDLALPLALVLGELIGEARAHLLHGENAARGLKSVMSARAGHEQVHGSEQKKEDRWRRQRLAFEKYRAQDHKITAAELLAAKECDVCARTIHEARKRTRVR